MNLDMKITNIKSIKELEFSFPLDMGIYAITGENGSGKSTIQTPCHDAGQYSADCVRYLLLSSFLKGEKRDLLLAGENGNY